MSWFNLKVQKWIKKKVNIFKSWHRGQKKNLFLLLVWSTTVWRFLFFFSLSFLNLCSIRSVMPPNRNSSQHPFLSVQKIRSRKKCSQQLLILSPPVMTIITWHDTCHLSLMTFLLLVLRGVAQASIHHRAAHACSTHSSCPHLSIGQGAERGVCRGCLGEGGGVCPVSAIYNSSTVWSPFSVGGCGQNSRTRNNIPFCAAQKFPWER